jgi:hypothetical protein
MKTHSKLKAAILSLIGLVYFVPTVQAQCGISNESTEVAKGVVYEDTNPDGRHNSSEPGVANVSVSNGCNLVLTNADGYYEISLAANQILFISQPSGYVVPVDSNNLPRFFYSHYPNGSPTAIAGTSVEWLWPVIEPTGPLPESIDFALHKLSSREVRFSAHAFADPQASSDQGEDMLREDLINTLLGNPFDAKFSITVGDVVFDNLGLYDRHKEMIGLIGIPQWNLPGNHDMNYESPNAHYANETYKKHFGPIYYSFNYGNAHIVALNNVEYVGAGQRGSNSSDYRGFISDDQMMWLEQDLANVPNDKLIVIATHIPLIAEASDGSAGSRITGPNTDNFSELLDILRPFTNIYGLAGHDTSNSWKVEINHNHGWTGQPWLAHTLAEVRGSGWTRGPRDLRGVADAMMDDGNPNGFYLLKFDDVTLVPEFIPFPYGREAAQRLRIVLDPALDTTESGINRGLLLANTKVVVNLFDGGERDEVSLSLDGGRQVSMDYVVRSDPFMERSYQQYADTDDAFTRPVASSHIWEYSLPENLMPGLHNVVVESEDEFGQHQRGVFTFELTGISQ